MKYLILMILISLSIPASAKRLAPATIQPLSTKRGTVNQSFERDAQGFSVYIISKDKAGDLRWKTKLFSGAYKKDLETDVQDVHLKKIYLEDMDIIAIDELGRKYRISSIDGEVKKK